MWEMSLSAASEAQVNVMRDSAIPATLSGLPAEILVEIFQLLDLPAVFKLSLANRGFQYFFERRRADILLPVLRRDFSPFNELVRVYVASDTDIAVSGGVYAPRRIIFKRYPQDDGIVMSDSRAAYGPGGQYMTDNKTAHPTYSRQGTIVLTDQDLDGLLKQCRLVTQWEELFPQMRWFHQPEDCRLLRKHEQVRFRRALYRWWLYGIYFHGEFPRPRVGHPEPHVEDVRISQMRYHSTGQLLELMDFLETIKDVILHYICPRLDPNQEYEVCTRSENALIPPASNTAQMCELFPLVEDRGRSVSLSSSWNDQSHWGRIVKTYAKLGPEDLLYYFNNIYSYPSKRLITDVRVRHPNFTFDQESIQVAIRCALDERNWLERSPTLAEHSGGGIIDFDDDRDRTRQALEGDASVDGRLPQGSRFVQSHSRYSPRGDDGSYLEEHVRRSVFETRFGGSLAMGTVP